MLYHLLGLHIQSSSQTVIAVIYCGSVCRQVTLSATAEPTYLLNPSSLFNYLCVLKKWCEASSTSDAGGLPDDSVLVWDWSGSYWCWMLNTELSELQVRITEKYVRWPSLKVWGSLNLLAWGVPLKEEWWKKVKLTLLEHHKPDVHLLIWFLETWVFVHVLVYTCLLQPSIVLTSTKAEQSWTVSCKRQSQLHSRVTMLFIHHIFWGMQALYFKSCSTISLYEKQFFWTTFYNNFIEENAQLY